MPIDIHIGASQSNFKDIADIANVMVAALALIVATISILFTRKSIKQQDRHNQLSVQPIPIFLIGDYENDIFVKITNNGLGPVFIVNFVANHFSSKADDLISLMPDCENGVVWQDFSQNISAYVIQPNSSLSLIQLSINDGIDEEFADKCRIVLKDVILKMTYTDIYTTEFPPVMRDLAWFGRRFEDDND